MKKLIILLIIAICIFIFIHSNTLEIKVVTKNVVEQGAYISETTSREYSLHWDRFIRYIEDIPRRVGIK
jgi:competence protein ComGC